MNINSITILTKHFSIFIKKTLQITSYTTVRVATFLFCFSTSCVPNVAIFSGFYFLNAPSVLSSIYLTLKLKQNNTNLNDNNLFIQKIIFYFKDFQPQKQCSHIVKLKED